MIIVYVIYMDILFLINFIMDCLVLLLVKKVLKQPTTWMRILSAASAGAAWVCFLSIRPIRNVLLEFIISCVLINGLMVFVAFKINQLSVLLKNIIALYISTFLMGGIFNSIYYHTNIGYYFNKIIRGEFEKETDIGIFLLIGIAAFYAAMKIIYVTDQKKKLEQSLFEVLIELNGKSVKTTGLLDTGNSLYEPISGKPVCIIEKEIIKDYVDFDDPLGFKVIPFKSIGKEQGIMYGITVNQLIIYIDKDALSINNAILGFYDKQFSKQKGYHMILHPELCEKVSG